VVSEELGKKLDTLEPGDLGRAGRVVVGKDTTTIIAGAGGKERVQARIEQLRAESKASKSHYDQEQLAGRIARLAGGVAVIHAGAPSEAALKSIKEAFDDAINATKAAIAEGIVPGSGLALLRAIGAVEAEEERCSGDERSGLRILKRALEAPTRQIARNSGLDDGVVVERMRTSAGNVGLDAATGRYLDLVEAGIIDPTKVVRVALENAVSVASLLLLSEATLVEVPEQPKDERGRHDLGADA
jgi:chaperonin GroEL